MSTNGADARPTRAAEEVGERGLAPRTGREAAWESRTDTTPPPPGFGIRPTSTARSESIRHPRRDVVAAFIIFLLLWALGGAYISGVFERHHNDNAPANSSSKSAY